MSDSLRPNGLYRPWTSPGQNTGVGSLIPSPGDLPDSGIQPGSPALQADSLPSEPHNSQLSYYSSQPNVYFITLTDAVGQEFRMDTGGKAALVPQLGKLKQWGSDWTVGS